MSTRSAEDRALSVLVNLTWLAPGIVGGSEESTTDALRALLDHRRDIELILAVQPDFPEAHPDLAGAVPCEVLDRAATNKVARVAGEQTWLASTTRRLAPDVTHHAGGVLPLVHPGRSVLTVHDLQPLDMPGNFAVSKRLYLRGMLGRSARAADLVCVPSEFTRHRVVERLGVPQDRVVVVPWSVVRIGTAGRGGSGDSPPTGGEAPVFVYPAITYPHKNHLMLLRAFAGVLDELPDARLVLPGRSGPLEDDVLERISGDDLRGRVSRPGRLSTAEMDGLYSRATAVVVPSTYEGFGLPALEAMVRGVPLIVSDAGSLPEVVTGGEAGPGGPVGCAAAPLDPADPAAWTAAMLAVAAMDEAQRDAVVRREHHAAQRFTPAATADALADAYRRAARGHISSLR